MPTYNTVDMMNCTKGIHSYDDGGEPGDECTVCGHVEEAEPAPDSRGNEIEVSFDVKASASVRFYIDRAEWNSMSDGEREARANEAIDSCQLAFDEIEVMGDSGWFYAKIESRDGDFGVYDPNDERKETTA